MLEEWKGGMMGRRMEGGMTGKTARKASIEPGPTHLPSIPDISIFQSSSNSVLHHSITPIFQPYPNNVSMCGFRMAFARASNRSTALMLRPIATAISAPLSPSK